ncbi:hypothetical protein [Brucella pseudogrignonensis]|uniref:hypothetical protein n=1 Tax=Brucella pseudogrignonensis TaxID=419475 RepID=UPI00148D4FFC|nr:hypothetical protein [Brucella pseudogrignonensis]
MAVWLPQGFEFVGERREPDGAQARQFYPGKSSASIHLLRIADGCFGISLAQEQWDEVAPDYRENIRSLFVIAIVDGSVMLLAVRRDDELTSAEKARTSEWNNERTGRHVRLRMRMVAG